MYYSDKCAVGGQVVSVIIKEALPRLYSNAMSGHLEFSTTNCVFERHPNAVDMFIDVLTDRGFQVSHRSRDIGGDPVRVDTQTGAVHRTKSMLMQSFRISFAGGNVRESNASAGHAPFGEPRYDILQSRICANTKHSGGFRNGLHHSERQYQHRVGKFRQG
jgi:hypothetical protein